MVVGGIPNPREDHAEAIAEIALDMQEFVEQFNAETNQGLSIRIGINSGPVVAGVVGTKNIPLRHLGGRGKYRRPHGVARDRRPNSGHRGNLSTP